MVVSGSRKRWDVGSIFHPQTKARTISGFFSGIFPANWGMDGLLPTYHLLREPKKTTIELPKFNSEFSSEKLT